MSFDKVDKKIRLNLYFFTLDTHTWTAKDRTRGKCCVLTCPVAVPCVAGDGLQQKLVEGHVAWVWSFTGTLLGQTQSHFGNKPKVDN